MGKPLFWGKLTLPLDSQTQCFLFNVQPLWSYDYSNRVIFTKNPILQWKILNFGSCKVGVENFCTKLPKGTPLRQIWSNKSFGVCGSDFVLTLESDEKIKKVRENRHWKLDVVYNTTVSYTHLTLPTNREV